MPKRTLLFALAWILGCSTAWAVLPADQSQFEVPLPLEMSAPAYQQLSAEEAAAAIPGWSAFTLERGSAWTVAQYRSDMGAPAAMFGPSFQLVDPQADDESIRQAATEFVSAHGALLKADPTQLGPAEADTYLGKTQVVFPQVYQGVPVIGGRVEVYVAQGKLVLLGSEFFSGVNVGTVPALVPEQAKAAAIEGMPFDAAQDEFVAEPRLVIYPIIQQSRPSYYLAYELQFTTTEPAGYWWAYIDASDGQVLTRTNNLSSFDLAVSVGSKVQLNYAQDPQVEIPSTSEQVLANSTMGYTDLNGQATFSVPLQQPYPVTSQLRGRYSIVINAAGAEATWSGEGTPGTPLHILWDDSNSLLAERDAYYSHNRIHDWLKRVDPGFTNLDYGMICNVNLAGSCNAFWNGSTINFYREGGGCVNMAQMSDVVMHEYGHAINQTTYSPSGPPSGPSGLSEGFSDIVAQTNTNDYLIGRGINSGSGYIRDARNVRQYPGTECGGQEHCMGEIIMGAMWKTRLSLINTYGYSVGVSLYDQIFRSAQRTKQYNMPAFLTRLLMADDDNANLNDGTPNWNEICVAFERHNLPCPAITQFINFTHTPVLDQTSTTSPYEVVTLIEAVNCGTLTPDSLRIVYSSDGTAWSNALLTPTGQPNEYRGYIPAQNCGTLVRYYLRARTSTNVTGLLPARAPRENVFRFAVGGTNLVLDDNLEADQGWTIGAPGDAATAGIWERVDPIGKTHTSGRLVQPEDDHTVNPGTLCFVTDGSGGIWPAGDVDGGATTIRSPIYDFTAGDGVGIIEFWGFFSNESIVNDTLRVSVSNNGGSTWLDLKKIYGQEACNWLQYRVYFDEGDLPFTNQMRVRFQIADFDGSSTEGAIDDITIRYTSCDITGVDEAEVLPSRLVVEGSRPNPMSDATSIRFALPASGSVSVDVFDAGGRVIRTLAQGALAAGPHSVSWDGRDAEGRQVSSGVYYYRVKTAGEEQTRKILLVR